MASDDDQRQVERMTSRTTVEVENGIPCPQAGEEMDVGEPSVQPRSVDEDQPRPETQSVPRPVEEQPILTERVGGSQGSGTRSIVEVPAHKTWRVEDVLADAADAAPEQMNSLVQSKTEVFEKIEESLRPLCMVENLNDDEIMELCILSNELNACEATAILNPSKFASCTTRLGLREGFAVDLTIARANGTMWDLSLEDDKPELRRVQNREQPELLVGSPPSDEFSSLLNTCAEALEISNLRTERIETKIRTCVQSYKLQMEMRKHFVHEHPEVSGSWEMPEVQSVIDDPRVYSIDGPMCRWSLRTRG